ncbi:hypothetical protein PMAYCL1PPCAC_28015, partial [Pristionchus mayeri]
LRTLLQTQGMHGNCKALLITSGLLQLAILVVQEAHFVHNFITDNRIHAGDNQKPFAATQNGLFIISSCMSLMLLLERTYAVWNCAKYEKTSMHFLPLSTLIGISILVGALGVYGLYWR